MAALAQVFGACWHLSEMCLGLLGFESPEQCWPVVFSALGHLTALKRLEIVCDNWKFRHQSFNGLSELTRLVGLEQLCLGFTWVRPDLQWGESGGTDWEQVLVACTHLTRLEFNHTSRRGC